MDESRVHGPVDVSYGSRCETGVERSFLINQRQSAATLHHPLNVRRSCGQAGDLRLDSDFGQHLHQPEALVKALSEWRQQAHYKQPEQGVFASPHTDGKHPYWPRTLLQRLVQPAALRAGISKRVGWHSFRRSFATLLYANEADVKTTQELMRHFNPTVTMGVYAHA